MPDDEERDMTPLRQWTRTTAYAALVVVTGVTYYLAQTAIDKNRAELPVLQYLDCVQKIATYDWSKFPGEKPSSSEVCKELTSRVAVQN
jgi:hypothetical protein